MSEGLEAMRRRTPGIALGLGAIVVCLGLRSAGAFVGLELAVYDRFVRNHSGEASGASPVVAIAIGESDFQRYGYPIPDAMLADVLRRLEESGAIAIGIDLYRNGPSSGSANDLAGWAKLRSAVVGNPGIVTSELLPSVDEPGTPPPDFVEARQIGFNNLLMDRGRVVRRGYMIAWDEVGNAHQSLSLRLALVYLAKHRIGMGPDPDEADWVRLGETTIPPLETDFGAYVDLDSGGYQFLLDYARPEDAFAVLPFGEIVDGNFDASRLTGRVAILGTDSPSVKDDFNAPYAAGRTVKGYRLHAHVADQLIRIGQGGEAPRGDWGEWSEAAWILAWGLGGIALSSFIGTLGWAVPGFVLGVFGIYAASAFCFAGGVWIPTIAPAFAWFSAGGLTLGDRARREARAQRQVMGLFRRFASRNVADTLWQQRDEFMDGDKPKPQRVTLTALLSDLKGYTEASEKMEPDALMEWIDSYMNAMTRVIEAHEGHVDDYVGDGIKANFGVPIPSETPEEISRDACRAVACAIEMGETLERLNADWAAKGWPTGRQRIGLFTGTAVVGSIGSEERLKYTSVGDTINTAARLESIGGRLDFDQEDSTQRILIGESTRSALGDAYRLEDCGEHVVKGKTEPLRIYRVIGEADGAARETGP